MWYFDGIHSFVWIVYPFWLLYCITLLYIELHFPEYRHLQCMLFLITPP